MKEDEQVESQKIPDTARKVFTGVLFDVYQWDQEMFDGSTAVFEKLRRQPGASIIPVLPDRSIILLEDEQPARPMKYTFPGGGIEGDEAPEDGACRELLEETGYAPKSCVLWKELQPASKMDWTVYTFIARGCEKVGEPALDSGERIKVRIVSLDEVIELADHPRFQNKELAIDLLKARYDAGERQKLERTLFGE